MKSSHQPVTKYLTSQSVEGENEVLDLRKIILVILKEWRLILTLSAVCAFLVVLHYFFYPKKHTIKMTVYHTEVETRSTLPVIGSLQGMPSLMGISLNQGNSKKEFIKKLLKSRTLADSVVSALVNEKGFKSFLGDKKTKNELRNELLRMIKFEQKKEETFFNVVLIIKDEWFNFSRKKLDSLMQMGDVTINKIFEVLNGLLQMYEIKQKVRDLEFFKHETKRAKIERDSAQHKLARFLSENKTVQIEEQARNQAEMIANIKAQMFVEKLNLDMLKQERISEDPFVMQARNKLKVYEKQYDDMLYGRLGGFTIGIHKLPKLQVEYLNLLLDTKLREQIYLLLKNIHVKKDLEIRNKMPAIEMLEPPQIPGSVVNKSTIIYSLVGFALIILVNILLIMLKYIYSLRNDPKNKPIVDALISIRNSFVFKKKKKLTG